jgi:hypothetical protein
MVITMSKECEECSFKEICQVENVPCFAEVMAVQEFIKFEKDYQKGRIRWCSRCKQFVKPNPEYTKSCVVELCPNCGKELYHFEFDTMKEEILI